MPFFDNYSSNSLIRKLRIKLTQRVGLCFLKPKIAPWRYQRGNRSLHENLKQTPKVQSTTPQAIDNADEDAEDEIPDCMEMVIDILLNGLRDKVCITIRMDGNETRILKYHHHYPRTPLYAGQQLRVLDASRNVCLKSSLKMLLAIYLNCSKKTLLLVHQAVKQISVQSLIAHGTVYP